MILRRIVTGHDASSKSVFLSDGPAPRSKAFEHTPGFVSNPIWTTRPGAGETDPTPAATTLHAAPGGSVMLIVTFPPDSVMQSLDMAQAWPEHLTELPGIAERFEPESPGMHRTDTTDYAIVLAGEIWLELDDGAEKRLTVHDVVVQQATRHAWRNKSDAPATLAFCMIGHVPTGGTAV